MDIGAYLFLFSFVFVGIHCDDDEEETKVVYRPMITDSVFSCDGFENELLDCSGLVLGSKKGEDGDSAKLGGTIATNGELIKDYDIEIDIWKMLDIGDEYMYNIRANLCDSFDNTDTPWYPIIQALNISSCPVPIDVFEIAELTISLDCVKDVMCHEFTGEYRIQMSIMDVADKISCHTIEICIVEDEETD
ncbi:uncharacterized protein LOC142975710 [Anticarsia gemmatalis]|uniref:uncharacterized protein LOC142975710 n=1 Tax=Anticarsia gemmatalis TaxID=129554 RepID=UPI003F77279B